MGAAAPLFTASFCLPANPSHKSFLLQSGLWLLLYYKKHAKIRIYRHIINSANCKEILCAGIVYLNHPCAPLKRGTAQPAFF